MDISDHLQSGFIKAPDLAGGPQRAVIEDVRQGRFERPDLHLRDGRIAGLNVTNLRTLSNAWGSETDDWIGKEIELSAGQIEFNGKMHDSVLIRPVSPAIPMAQRKKPAPKQKPDFDDEIPFSLATAWLASGSLLLLLLSHGAGT
jgi:hypothetical protein